MMHTTTCQILVQCLQLLGLIHKLVPTNLLLLYNIGTVVVISNWISQRMIKILNKILHTDRLCCYPSPDGCFFVFSFQAKNHILAITIPVSHHMDRIKKSILESKCSKKLMHIIFVWCVCRMSIHLCGSEVSEICMFTQSRNECGYTYPDWKFCH
jgi:hypothetical protein